MSSDGDYAKALLLQQQFDNERGNEMVCLNDSKNHSDNIPDSHQIEKSSKKSSLIDPTWEYIDPTPSIHDLFMQFDNTFFWGKLKGVEVRWSPRMTTCAGICCYEGHGGLCSVRLSVPLLKLRPRKDLVETLLHEMIHAYLFVTRNNRDRDGHGPEFHKHMYRINEIAGTNITVFHNFHDEVRLYKQHWWRCNGPCKSKPPYYGTVKRAMNRAPGPSDFWWKEHEANCGGLFIKVKEPEGFSEKKSKDGNKKDSSSSKADIRNFLPFNGKGTVLGSNNTKENQNFPVKKTSLPEYSNTAKTNIMSFTDLQNRNANGENVNGKMKNRTDNENKQKSPIVNGFNSQNKRKNNVVNEKNPISNNAAQTNSFSGKASNVRAGGFGGMLANKGGGTLVVTAKGSKGNNKDTTNAHNPKGPLQVGPSFLNNFVPFSGKGYTLGSENSDKTKEVNKCTDSYETKLDNKSVSTVNSNKRYLSNEEDSNGKKKKSDSGLLNISEPEQNSSFGHDLVKCPVCYLKVREIDINTHLDSCTASSDECIEIPSDDCIEIPLEEVKCPSCTKVIKKIDMGIHLEDCLEGVFQNSASAVDNWSDDTEEGAAANVSDDSIDKLYQCPNCPQMIRDAEMNAHLDICLST